MNTQLVLLIDTFDNLGVDFTVEIVEIDKNKYNEVLMFADDHIVSFLFTLQGTFIQPEIADYE